MIRIALTYTGSEKSHENYQKWLSEAGADVVTLSPTSKNLGELQTCHGLVLSGGKDIHPKFYKSSNLTYPGAPKNFDEDRDAFELNALSTFLETQKPILGICRGLQLINCKFGGTLKQDLGELNKVHKRESKESNDKRHLVTLDPSRLFQIINTPQGEVNSSHHQAIDRLGEGLIVNCRSADGTIEGIEWGDPENKPYMLAVQWHPERMEDKNENPLSIKIRDSFIEAVNTAKV